MSVAHKILIAAYHMLARASAFRELGAAYLSPDLARRTKARLVKQLEHLGYRVQLEPAATA